MKYNRPYSRARSGTMAKDFEKGVDFDRLRRDRLARAQAALKRRGLGGVICFDLDNIRYITGTAIAEIARDFMMEYCLLPADGKPYLFDLAVPAKRLSAPWMEDRLYPPISILKGALPPEDNVQAKFAQQIKRLLADHGADKLPLGADYMEIPMLRALEHEGLTVVDGVQALLDAREIKTPDEIELLKQVSAIADGVHDVLSRTIRPGVKESDLVAVASKKFHELGAERVETIQAVTGPRGLPHSHTPSDRIIQPGDMVFIDPLGSFMGYRTCYYRCFVCGKPNRYQEDAYERASKWLSDAIDVIRPGVTTADIAKVWPRAEEFGYRNEDEAFLQQFGHGIGVSLWERPIISRRVSFDHPQTIREGMVFAVETWCGAEDRSGAARIEELVVVTADGCELITNFPSDHLISCGLPGCEVN
jgi:Xaa-Pro dipeptidase